MRRHLLLACCVCIWMSGRSLTSATAFGGDTPSATELRGLVVEPLRGLHYGTYKTRIKDNILRRTAAKHITFKRDCIRVDTFGLESVTVVRKQSGETTPYVVAPGTSFVAQEAICGEEYVTYNPAKEIGGSKFSVSVQKLSDPAAAVRVRDRFFDPRFIGISPKLIGHLRLDSWSNSLYETVAVEASVSQVELEGEDALLLEQRLDRGQVIRHWVSPTNYAVIMAEVISGEGSDRCGTRMKFTNKRVETPLGDVSFPVLIEGFTIGTDNSVTLASVDEVEDIDFKTPIEDRVFTVLGMEPSEGTYVYTQPPQANPLREIRDGQVVPVTRVSLEVVPPNPAKAKESPWLSWILAVNIVAIAVCFGIAYRLKRGLPK